MLLLKTSSRWQHAPSNYTRASVIIVVGAPSESVITHYDDIYDASVNSFCFLGQSKLVENVLCFVFNAGFHVYVHGII